MNMEQNKPLPPDGDAILTYRYQHYHLTDIGDSEEFREQFKRVTGYELDHFFNNCSVLALTPDRGEFLQGPNGFVLQRRHSILTMSVYKVGGE